MGVDGSEEVEAVSSSPFPFFFSCSLRLSNQIVVKTITLNAAMTAAALFPGVTSHQHLSVSYGMLTKKVQPDGTYRWVDELAGTKPRAPKPKMYLPLAPICQCIISRIGERGMKITLQGIHRRRGECSLLSIVRNQFCHPSLGATTR